MQPLECAVEAQPKDRSVTLTTANSGPTEPAIGALDQVRVGRRSVAAAGEGVQLKVIAVCINPENGSRIVAASSDRGAVQISVRGLHQATHRSGSNVERNQIRDLRACRERQFY